MKSSGTLGLLLVAAASLIASAPADVKARAGGIDIAKGILSGDPAEIVKGATSIGGGGQATGAKKALTGAGAPAGAARNSTAAAKPAPAAGAGAGAGAGVAGALAAAAGAALGAASGAGAGAAPKPSAAAGGLPGLF